MTVPREDDTHIAQDHGELGDVAISDDELTALALASDPDVPLGPDALPLHHYLSQLPALLPDWYMPQVMARSGNRWRSTVVLAVVVAFLIIEALGLCSAYGQLSPG